MTIRGCSPSWQGILTFSTRRIPEPAGTREVNCNRTVHRWDGVATRPWRTSGCTRWAPSRTASASVLPCRRGSLPAGERFRTCWQPAVRQDGEDRPGTAVAEPTALGRPVGLARRHAAHRVPRTPSSRRTTGPVSPRSCSATGATTSTPTPTPTPTPTTSTCTCARPRPHRRPHPPPQRLGRAAAPLHRFHRQPGLARRRGLRRRRGPPVPKALPGGPLAAAEPKTLPLDAVAHPRPARAPRPPTGRAYLDTWATGDGSSPPTGAPPSSTDRVSPSDRIDVTPATRASIPVRTRPNTRNGRSSDPHEPEITPQPSPKSAKPASRRNGLS